jgi:hypothetical protein
VQKPLEAFASSGCSLPCYLVVEDAAGVLGAGAVFGAIGADGRVVEEPTVVPVPLFSAVRGPLQGAHINKSATTAIVAIIAIIPASIPSHRAGPVLIVRLRSWSSLSTGGKRKDDGRRCVHQEPGLLHRKNGLSNSGSCLATTVPSLPIRFEPLPQCVG